MESPETVQNSSLLSERIQAAFAMIDARAPGLKAAYPEEYGRSQIRAFELVGKGFDLTSLNLAEIVPPQFIRPEIIV